MLERAKNDGIELIITCDCGSSNCELVKYAESIGLKIVVTDHHELHKNIPDVIVNPKISYPFNDLSGAVVAYKTAQALAMKKLGITALQWYNVKRDYIIMTMLGILGDRVLMFDENRILVKFGLEYFKNPRKPGLIALKDKCGDEITAEGIIKRILPLIAAGRLAPENPVPKLFLEDNYETCRKIIEELEKFDSQWQIMVSQAYEECVKHVDSAQEILIVKTEQPEIVLGTCAARLARRFGKPAFVIGKRGDKYIGEGRSYNNCDLFDILQKSKEYFVDYGGHKSACGFTLKPDKLNEFIDHLKKLQCKYESQFMEPIREIEISLDDLKENAHNELKKLAPFGPGNPPPTFVIKNVKVGDLLNYGIIAPNMPKEKTINTKITYEPNTNKLVCTTLL